MGVPESVKRRLRTPVLATRRLRSQGLRPIELAYASPRSFSQFGEDQWLSRHFAGIDHGCYVDVGAYHPYSLSNTHLLHRKGWSGINLEPQPANLELFRRHRPHDSNLGYAVSQTPGTVTFAVTGSFAGIDDDQHLWPGMAGPRIQVEARRLDDLLAEHLQQGRGIDLLDVDCEGHDLDVLMSNDWTRFRPGVVLAEVHHGDDHSLDPGAFLADQGYELATRLDLTSIYVDLKR